MVGDVDDGEVVYVWDQDVQDSCGLKVLLKSEILGLVVVWGVGGDIKIYED